MSQRKIQIDLKKSLSLDDISAFAFCSSTQVHLSTEAEFRKEISSNRKFLEDQLEGGCDIYGVTTGYGNSSSNRLQAAQALTLQHNLIQYHGCGIGEYLSEAQCAASLLVRLNCLAKGFSGVSLELLERLTKLASERVFPAIPEMGSVGASGDLTPLSYIAACLEGDREVWDSGKIRPTRDVFRERGLTGYTFQAKEALAIMNGTSVMTGVAALAWHEAKKVADLACVMTGIMVEVLDGRAAPFMPELHSVKPHPGQGLASASILSFIKDPDTRLGRKAPASTLPQGATQPQGAVQPARLQDSYSIRCAPQVIGVLYDVLGWSKEWLEIEMNSVNDNPVLFHKENRILNGGHFFGGHVAAACDALKTATANVLNLVDKQMAILVDSRFNGCLPDNLVACAQLGDQAPLHHGFKAMQISLTALTAEALKRSIPTSIFSRSTECLNQDVVSLGTIAARDLQAITTLAKPALTIQAMALRQAAFILGEEGFCARLNPKARQALEAWMALCEPVIEDRPLDKEIRKVTSALFDSSWKEA